MADVSLSARRAWIEILKMAHHAKNNDVALRKESVDRNPIMQCFTVVSFGRSPQGERG